MRDMRKTFLFLFYLLAGIITGSLLASVCVKSGALSFLGYASTIGLPSNTAVIDLIIIKISFGFTMTVSIAQIITISLAMMLYRRTV